MKTVKIIYPHLGIVDEVEEEENEIETEENSEKNKEKE